MTTPEVLQILGVFIFSIFSSLIASSLIQRRRLKAKNIPEIIRVADFVTGV